jgi:hypothetical protein
MRQGVRGWLVVSSVVLAVAAVAGVATLASASDHTVSRRLGSTAPSKCINTSATQRGRTIFGELRRLGVRVWSTGISWAAIAPTRPADPQSPGDPAYHWPQHLDAYLDQARRIGIEPVLYVNSFPSWSNGGRNQSWAPQRPSDYGDFMAAAVHRYPQVRRWIAFSEPTNYVNFQPQGGHGRTAPHLYAKLLDAAYGAMHAARRDVVVVGGNVHPAGFNDQTTTAPDTFIQNMVLPNGRRPRLDMFGVNPYTERPIDLRLRHLPHRVDLDDLDWLARRLDQLWPKRHLRLFVDEMGWNTEHPAQGWLYVVSRKAQAQKLTAAYRLSASGPRRG